LSGPIIRILNDSLAAAIAENLTPHGVTTNAPRDSKAPLAFVVCPSPTGQAGHILLCDSGEIWRSTWARRYRTRLNLVAYDNSCAETRSPWARVWAAAPAVGADAAGRDMDRLAGVVAESGVVAGAVAVLVAAAGLVEEAGVVAGAGLVEGSGIR